MRDEPAAALESIEAGEAVAAIVPEPPAGDASNGAADAAAASDESGPPAFSEAAESAFLGEARERGETVRSPERSADSDDDTEVGNGKSLPRLEELVNRIPAGVRATLDELFRAHFVSVRRIPKKALKE